MFDLDNLKWKKRILVVKLPTVESAESALLRATLEARKREVDNRHLVLIQLCDESESRYGKTRLSEVEAQTLSNRLALNTESQGIWLIGKDGTIKARYDLPLNLNAVFAKIDTMSMRKREMKNDQ